MGTNHPPRDKQANLDQPSLWIADLPMALSLYLRVPFEGINLHFGMTNTATTSRVA